MSYVNSKLRTEKIFTTYDLKPIRTKLKWLTEAHMFVIAFL